MYQVEGKDMAGNESRGNSRPRFGEGALGFLSAAMKTWLDVGDLCGSGLNGVMDRQSILKVELPGNQSGQTGGTSEAPSRHRSRRVHRPVASEAPALGAEPSVPPAWPL